MPIDYKQYPKNWKTEIRPAVLSRAGNCCEFCGVPNHQFIIRPIKGKTDWVIVPDHHMDDVKSVRIVLTIAHLDHDKMNHSVSIDRLRALCQRCHLLYDIKHHVANRKYGRDHNKNLKLF